MVSKSFVKTVLCIIVLIWEVQGADKVEIKIISPPQSEPQNYDKLALKAVNVAELKNLCHGKISIVQKFLKRCNRPKTNMTLDDMVNKLNKLTDKYVSFKYHGIFVYDKQEFKKNLSDTKRILTNIGNWYKTEKNRVDTVCNAMIENLKVMAKSTVICKQTNTDYGSSGGGMNFLSFDSFGM